MPIWRPKLHCLALPARVIWSVRRAATPGPTIGPAHAVADSTGINQSPEAQSPRSGGAFPTRAARHGASCPKGPVAAREDRVQAPNPIYLL